MLRARARDGVRFDARIALRSCASFGTNMYAGFVLCCGRPYPDSLRHACEDAFPPTLTRALSESCAIG